MGRTTVKSQKKQGSRWPGVLFGLVFFSVGAGFPVFSVVPNLWDVTRMQDWVQVPADAIAGQRRVKGIRQLVSVASTVFFFAFVFWQFRDVIFRLL
jgi:hypothetical protein